MSNLMQVLQSEKNDGLEDQNSHVFNVTASRFPDDKHFTPKTITF